jgi:hypothetical protein
VMLRSGVVVGGGCALVSWWMVDLVPVGLLGKHLGGFGGGG